MSAFRHLRLIIFVSTFCLACGCSSNAGPTPPERQTDLYINPQPVEISGYGGSAMEPFISLDGNLLFFNTDDDPKTKSKTMHFAARTGPLSFRYLGELPGVNMHISHTVEAAAPSIDAQGSLFFTSMRQYDKDFHSVFAGRFDGKAVTNIHAIDGDINPRGEAGTINMDVGISPDGNTLYISRTHFNPLLTVLFHAPPTESHLLVAHRDSDKFTLDPQSAAIMKKVNTSALEYAPAISADGLELFFTRVSEGTGPRIMVASRAATDQPFDQPCAIKALTGFVEGPSISIDGKQLFFHKKVNDTFVIYRAERNPDAEGKPLPCR